MYKSILDTFFLDCTVKLDCYLSWLSSTYQAQIHKFTKTFHNKLSFKFVTAVCNCHLEQFLIWRPYQYEDIICLFFPKPLVIANVA